MECPADPSDSDRVLEPSSYDPDLVDKRTAKRLDKQRRFRKPWFWRFEVFKLWPQDRGFATVADAKRAIALLEPSLRANNHLKRQDALEICRKKVPNLSERLFDSHVWRQARQAAGLKPVAPPGRKPNSRS